MFEDSTHGGRQNWWLRYPTFLRTSTHALTEGDSFIGNWRCALIISTHALTEGDKDSVAVAADALISTHALTEGDAVLPGMYRRTAHFNSRPHGGRRTSYTVSYECLKFQLTPSRRATLTPPTLFSSELISTHALTEGDVPSCSNWSAQILFQLTPSRRATDDVRKKVQNLSNFNSRPHGGRLRCSGAFRSWKYISTHALTEGDNFFYDI